MRQSYIERMTQRWIRRQVGLQTRRFACGSEVWRRRWQWRVTHCCMGMKVRSQCDGDAVQMGKMGEKSNTFGHRKEANWRKFMEIFWNFMRILQYSTTAIVILSLDIAKIHGFMAFLATLLTYRNKFEMIHARGTILTIRTHTSARLEQNIS